MKLAGVEFAILISVQALIAVFENQWFWVLYSYASQQINLVNEHLLEKSAWIWMTVCHNTKRILLTPCKRQKGKVIKLMAQPSEIRLFHTSEKWMWSWLRTSKCKFIRNSFFLPTVLFPTVLAIPAYPVAAQPKWFLSSSSKEWEKLQLWSLERICVCCCLFSASSFPFTALCVEVMWPDMG